MPNCDICGFHLDDGNTPCPNCAKIQTQSAIPKKNYTEAELAAMPICETCGHHYENTAENHKVCPNCRAIRIQSSDTHRAGGKTTAELEAERKQRQYETPVEQVVLDDPDKFKRMIPVMIAGAAVVIAVIAAVLMN